MLNVDYVIYCSTVRGKYAYFDSDEYSYGWAFCNVLEADGFNCSDDALARIKGRILPSGRVQYKADPELKDCVVLKRTTMVEVEPV